MPQLSNVPFLKPDAENQEVLFIGNSYTMSSNLPHVVKAFLKEREITATLRKTAAGGATFEEHWNGKRELRTREILSQRPYQLVVLQANSRAALDQRQETLDYAKQLIDAVKSRGAFPLLYETWARQDSIDDQELISGMYREIAEENDAVVVPVGQAWKLAREEWPDMPLFTGDGHHPMGIGTYLAACVMFECLSGQSCIGLDHQPIVHDGDDEFIILMYLDPEHAAFCQRIAHQAVTNLYSTPEAKA